MKTLLVFFSITLFTSSIMISQTVRLVDQGGLPGSYPTITAAVTAANSGDTIKVFSGIYNESVTINKKLFIYAQDSTVEVVSGSNTFYFTNGSSGSLLYGFTVKGIVYHDHSFAQTEPIIISNNRFINGQVNFRYWTIIANNYFVNGVDGNGIYSYGSDSSHKRIVIFDNRLDSCRIQLSGNYTDLVSNSITNYSSDALHISNVNDCQIIANKFNNISASAIQLQYQSLNISISNNLITNCFNGISGHFIWYPFSVIISNNVIHNNSNTAIMMGSYHANGTINLYGNIFSNNGGNLTAPVSVWDYNCVYNSGTVPTPGIGNITSDPLFTNPAGGNFTLQPGSLAINAGPPHIQYSDIDRTRNDMGIYGGSYTMVNYENNFGPKVISLSTLPTQVIKGNNVVITGSGISK